MAAQTTFTSVQCTHINHDTGLDAGIYVQEQIATIAGYRY